MITKRSTAFTLLELCLALVIGSMVMLLAVPSIAGLLAEQRLKESFGRFDRMVATARRKSVTEQRTWTMAWDKSGITLRSADSSGEPDVIRFPFRPDEGFELRRSASLRADAPAEWTFWSNGICEPARIAYHGKAGSWLVRYDPLTARGTFLQSDVP